MKKALLVSVVLALVVSAWAQDNTMMKSDKATPADGTMMKSESSMVSDADKKMSADPMDSSAFNLKGLGKQVSAWTTTSDAMKDAKMKDLTVVYFFAATWCPDCQATYQDLKANFAMLPMNFKVVFVNYDKSVELKKKYGITAQHTFLTVGPNGEKKKVWNGGNTVAELIKNASSM